MTQAQTPLSLEIREIQNRLIELDRDVNDRGEEGLKARIYNLESIMPRMEMRMMEFMHEIKKVVADKKVPERKESWFHDRVLPTVISSVMTSIILIVLFILSVVVSPVVDQMIAHALK